MTNSSAYLADHYKSLGDMQYDFRNKNLIRLVSSYVLGSKVLDIGSGSGAFLHLMQLKGKEVYGVEPNEDLVKLTKQLYFDLKIYQKTAESIEDIPDVYDTIAMMDVLEHIDNDDAQLKKIHNRLKDNGILIIVVPAFQWLYGIRDERQGHYRRYSKNKLIQLLIKNNFKIEKMRFWNALGLFPYFFYERVLKREITIKSRKRPSSMSGKLINKLIQFWFKFVENNVNFGFGLSLLCVARKK